MPDRLLDPVFEESGCHHRGLASDGNHSVEWGAVLARTRKPDPILLLVGAPHIQLSVRDI